MGKYKKILIVYNSGLIEKGQDIYVENGVGQFLYKIKSKGYTPIIFSQRLSLKNLNDLSGLFSLIKNGIKVKSLKRKNNKLINYILLYAVLFIEIFKADYIYIFWPNAFKYGALISLLLRKRYGIYIRGCEEFKTLLSRFVFKHAKKILTVSDYFTNYINNNIKKGITETIYPMIYFSIADINREKKYVIKDIYNLLFVGRLAKDKGIYELVEALYHVKKRGGKFVLKIVGNGVEFNSLNNKIKIYDLIDQIKLEGGTTDKNKIKEYYYWADLFIFPSYHGEGFPRALYEAMIFGTPIITTFVGAIPFLMKNRWNCIEIRPRDIYSIINALEYAFSNYPELGEYSYNATMTVLNALKGKRFHDEIIIEELEKNN